MADEFYALDAKSVRDLSELLAAYRRGELRGARPSPSNAPGMFRVEFGKAASAIPGVTAFGSTNPSSGTVGLYTLGSTGNAFGTAFTVTAYNLSTVDVSTSQWVQLLYNERSGQYLIHGTLEGRKVTDLVRVVLSTSLNQSTTSITAKVTNQYGLGLPTSTDITLRNLSISANSLFAGSTGHAGYAIPTATDDGRIIQMECT